MDLREARERTARRWRLNAFVTMCTGEGGGPVVAVKDNLDVAGVPTTVGTVTRPAVPAAADSDVVAHLRAHGGVVIGKTSLGQWALDVTGTAQAFGPVRNPHDENRTAGGSSSGSAVAVAAGLCDWAIGSDTGGSVRLPAALCGVVGFKPSFGALGGRGLVPSCPSMDTIGPLAPTVPAAAAAFAAMGAAPGAPARRDVPRLAVPRGWVGELDATVAAAWARAGSGLAEVDLPPLPRFHEVFLALGMPEAAHLHRHTPPAHLSPGIRGVLEAGAAVSALEHLAAREAAVELRDAVEAALGPVDALALPTAERVAPRLDEAFEARASLTRFVRPFSLTGHPAISVPVPTGGLPAGIQLVGRLGRDHDLLAVAETLHRRWWREHA